MNILRCIYEKKNDINKFLFISSSTGYPKSKRANNEKQFFKDEPDVFLSGWLNRYIEKLIEHFSKITNNRLETVIIRPAAIFGKYDDFNFKTCHSLPAIIRRFSERHDPLTIYGNGYDFKNWIFVEDMIKIIIKILLKNKNKLLVTNICDDKSYSLRQIATKLAKISGYNPKINYTEQKNKKKSVRKFSNLKLKKFMKKKYKLNFDLSLKKTYNWYKKYGS